MPQTTIDFHLSPAERELVNRIIDRVLPLMPGTDRDRQTIEMDLAACHKNGNPLNLERMANWPRDFDLLHDVYGINRHIDRNTGKLLDFFSPRFTA